MRPQFFQVDQVNSFSQGQLVKLNPSWRHGYIGYVHTEPSTGWPNAVLIEADSLGVYIKFISDFTVSSAECGDEFLNYPYYPVDVVLFGDNLVEIPLDVIVPVIIE